MFTLCSFVTRLHRVFPMKTPSGFMTGKILKMMWVRNDSATSWEEVRKSIKPFWTKIHSKNCFFPKQKCDIRKNVDKMIGIITIEKQNSHLLLKNVSIDLTLKVFYLYDERCRSVWRVNPGHDDDDLRHRRWVHRRLLLSHWRVRRRRVVLMLESTFAKNLRQISQRRIVIQQFILRIRIS